MSHVATTTSGAPAREVIPGSFGIKILHLLV